MHGILRETSALCSVTWAKIYVVQKFYQTTWPSLENTPLESTWVFPAVELLRRVDCLEVSCEHVHLHGYKTQLAKMPCFKWAFRRCFRALTSCSQMSPWRVRSERRSYMPKILQAALQRRTPLLQVVSICRIVAARHCETRARLQYVLFSELENK